MTPLHQLKCTHKNSICTLHTASASSAVFTEKKKKGGKLCLSLHHHVTATDLGSEFVGLSAHWAKIHSLQYFSCKVQSSLEFISFEFILQFSRKPPGETGALFLHYFQVKRSHSLREVNLFPRGLLELLLQEDLERGSHICFSAATYLTCKVRQNNGWDRDESKISQTLWKDSC